MLCLAAIPCLHSIHRVVMIIFLTVFVRRTTIIVILALQQIFIVGLKITVCSSFLFFFTLRLSRTLLMHVDASGKFSSILTLFEYIWKTAQ
jgi:hypothetical protein